MTLSSTHWAHPWRVDHRARSLDDFVAFLNESRPERPPRFFNNRDSRESETLTPQALRANTRRSKNSETPTTVTSKKDSTSFNRATARRMIALKFLHVTAETDFNRPFPPFAPSHSTHLIHHKLSDLPRSFRFELKVCEMMGASQTRGKKEINLHLTKLRVYYVAHYSDLRRAGETFPRYFPR